MDRRTTLTAAAAVVALIAAGFVGAVVSRSSREGPRRVLSRADLDKTMARVGPDQQRVVFEELAKDVAYDLDRPSRELGQRKFWFARDGEHCLVLELSRTPDGYGALTLGKGQLDDCSP